MSVVESLDEKRVGMDEPSYVRELLPVNWWNDVGAMEKAFDWNAAERKTLDRALEQCKKGPAFCDDLGPYVEALRTLVRYRLKALALEEYEANRRA